MKPLHHALILYGIFVALLYTIRPDCFFDEDGEFKLYGLGPGSTMFPCSAICIIAAITIYAYTVTFAKNDIF